MLKNNSQGLGGFGIVPVALFLVLVLSGSSILALTLKETPKGAPSFTVVDENGILSALLDSTVDRTTYTDNAGLVHVYIGWTVKELIVEDLEFRSTSSPRANVSSLNSGIESDINQNLHNLTGVHHYDMKATFGGAYFRVKDLDLNGNPEATISVHMPSFGSDAKVSLWMTE